MELDARMGGLGATVRHCPDFLADVRDHSEGRVSRQDLLERPEVLKDAVRAYSSIFGHARAAGVDRTAPPMVLFMEDVRLLGSRAEKLAMPEEFSACATMMNEVFGPGAKTGLTLSARIDPMVEDLVADPGAKTTCPIRVRNDSTISYRDGSWPVYLSYHLLSAAEDLLQHDNPRTKFEEILRPGEERIIELKIDAPETAGDYILSVDLVLERITWFEAEGTRPGVVRLRVEERAKSQPIREVG